MIAVDLFAGGGGASLAIETALGVAPVLAVNHCEHAIEMHRANHPRTLHYHSDVFRVKPRAAVGRDRVDLLWASPDCTHFSRAKGGKPRKKEIRGLAWVVIDWAREVRPRVIALENVAEFQTWGPLDESGKPIKARAGETFNEWVSALRALGYEVEWRVLNAADYGAATARKRLFIVARRDGKPIGWPEPTHGLGLEPYRAAAECIDWSIPCPSIFARKRPLAEATQRRIAEGVRRYVLDCPRPFIVQTGHQSSDGGKVRSVGEPLSTVVTKAEHCLVSPALIQVGYGERRGQAPRVLDLQAPLGTVVAGGAKHALVAAFLAKHYTGAVGSDLRKPLGTVTAIDHHSLVAAHLTKFYGTSTGAGMDQPLPTVTAGGGRGGGHAGLVAAFLCKYYGTGVGQPPGAPLGTVTSRDRFGLVTVTIDGEPYAIADIGLRMLQPRELARAMGWPDSYRLIGTKAQQVARIGNGVERHVAAALLRANLPRASSPVRWQPNMFGMEAAK